MNYFKFLRSGIFLLLLGTISFTFTSCMKEKVEPPKSMEQIKSEEGIPVTVIEVKTSGFSKELSYFAQLVPIKETVEISKVSDKIIKLNVSVGDYVKEGQIVMEFPSNNPALQYDQAKAALDNAEITVKRMKELLDAGEISQQMYDNTNTQYIVSKRNFEQLNQVINVKAPASGMIINLPYRAGDVPELGKVLFSVANTGKMIAKLNVSDKEIGFIKKGMEADVRWNGSIFKGRVSMIGLEMSPMTRSFPVEIELNNPKNELKSGLSVDVRIKISDESEIIAIDRKYIIDDNDKKFVFVSDNGKSVKKEVTTGKESGVMVEITGGLNVGESLISCCTTFLEDGTKIKVESKGSK
ncbi:MAG: efflux RND transporter periplasmic adaptor subunit [Candidatus Kapabacteria bacterium]|nr:efflux RND transporter periplasmic adaptor subunit [Ignavibacteriota bacterium]MCW5883348.1 efflux RND transporter periplasmic adaptor subunit [Candidatus Kapabacteria bacterium]